LCCFFDPAHDTTADDVRNWMSDLIILKRLTMWYIFLTVWEKY